MRAHNLHHTPGSFLPEGGLALAGHEQGVHEGLRVLPPNLDQQVVDQTPYHYLGGVDACDDLYPHTWLQ